MSLHVTCQIIHFSKLLTLEILSSKLPVYIVEHCPVLFLVVYRIYLISMHAYYLKTSKQISMCELIRRKKSITSQICVLLNSVCHNLQNTARATLFDYAY